MVKSLVVVMCVCLSMKGVELAFGFELDFWARFFIVCPLSVLMALIVAK